MNINFFSPHHMVRTDVFLSFSRLSKLYHALSPTQSGGGEIRTLDALRHAAFPRRCTRPLCDASVQKIYITLTLYSHLRERSDALLNRWVGTEYSCDKSSGFMRTERIRDEKMCGRMIRAAHRRFV